jgi:iron complex transport system substrate-binding protein
MGIRKFFMKKIVLIFLVVALAVSLPVASCNSEKEEEALPEYITITDSAGRVVEVPQPLERIAVWGGGSAEIIRALGAEDRIIGISEFMVTVYPYLWPELQDRPTIGSWVQPDYEKVVDVEPQALFTLVGSPADAEEQLEGTGIKVIRMNFFRAESIKDIETFGLILGKEKEAGEFTDFLRSKLDLIVKRVKEIRPEEKKRVYFESGHQDYYAWGPGSGKDERLGKAGGINIFADLGMEGSEVDPEEILERDPDVIFKDGMGAKYGGYTAVDASVMEAKREEMMSRPGWSELKAVKNGQVYIEGEDLDLATGVIYVSYLARLLYPDRFEDLDVEDFHREYIEKYQGLEFKGIYMYPCPWRNE